MQYHNTTPWCNTMQKLTLTERAWVLYLFPLETPCRARPVHVFDKWERWVRRFPTKVSQTAPTKEAETDESVFAAGLCARCHSATVRSEKQNDFLPDTFFVILCHFMCIFPHFVPFRSLFLVTFCAILSYLSFPFSSHTQLILSFQKITLMIMNRLRSFLLRS